MRTCIGFPSFLPLASWAPVGGTTFDSAHPIANLGDMLNLGRTANATSSGMSVQAALSSVQQVQLVALCYHNLQYNDQVRVRCYSDNFVTLTYDSGNVSPWPNGAFSTYASYRFTFPMLLASPVAALGVQIDITPAGGNPSPVIGCIELAGALLWTDVKSDMQRGINLYSQQIQDPGGGYAMVQAFDPRTATLNRDNVLRTEIESSILDLKTYAKQSTPFLYVRDIDDSTTWPREAYVARQSSNTNATVSATDAGSDQIALEEHLG